MKTPSFRNLVIAYTATDAGRDALNLGLAMARTSGAHLNLVTVVPEENVFAAIYPSDRGHMPIIQQQVRQWLEEAQASLPADISSSIHTVSGSSDAAGLLADLWLCPFGDDPTFRLPGEAYMVATLARARANDRARIPPPVARLHGRSGRWLTIRGDFSLTPDRKLAGVVLIIERSRPAEILPLAVAAYGLTAREREVLGQLSCGRTTAEIAAELFITEHTVRDHIKSILTKTGTTSRGELISLLFREETPSL